MIILGIDPGLARVSIDDDLRIRISAVCGELDGTACAATS